ncbi:rhodanese-like domain-containing protein [Gillisia sp. M10.2A]|uniref:Rhodanese-like domain-containing protein n=1 Tax=Gillisia lutea TaxID=2909668 RepID=A0ABS9EEX1_9FLAO|nr:rhodanese-like domain-containing protein [Gillisia lutea]MCF4101427.1 rhodanese-like domain-containing protein [Gillisia lutea]
MNFLKLFILMGFFSSIFGASAQSSDKVSVLSVTEFKEQINNGKVTVIDVRTPQEYKEGHIKNAKNYNFFDVDFTSKFSSLKKDQPVYLYCRSGNRSNKAAHKLATMGFEKIYDLKGGYMAWR